MWTILFFLFTNLADVNGIATQMTGDFGQLQIVSDNRYYLESFDTKLFGFKPSYVVFSLEGSIGVGDGWRLGGVHKCTHAFDASPVSLVKKWAFGTKNRVYLQNQFYVERNL